MIEFIREYAGLISGIISFWAYLIYIFAILRGQTKPSRSTWWILTLVGALILGSAYSLGARESIWIQLSYVVGPFIVAILSVKHGEGQGFSRLDIVCIFGALISASFWIIFNSPLIGLIGSIGVDFIGLIPTLKKSFFKPEEESPESWLTETFASFINMLAVTAWFSLEHKDWIYALYLFSVNGLITLFLWRKRLWSHTQGI